MKNASHKWFLTFLFVVGSAITQTVYAQGSIEVSILNPTFTTSVTGDTLTFDVYGRQGSNYSSGGTDGLFAGNLRFDIVVGVSGSGTFSLTNSSGLITNKSTIFTTTSGTVMNATSVPTYSGAPSGANAKVGFQLSRPPGTANPDLPISSSSMVRLFTASFPFTITTGCSIISDSFYLRTSTAGNGSSWSSTSASGNSFFHSSVPLPIGLINFDVTVTNDCKSQLNWEVSFEQNFDHYEALRSLDGGINFSKLEANVTVSGNSKQNVKYQRYDLSPANGDNFYRLKMVEKNGTCSYSAIKKVHFECQSDAISVYPTETKDGFVHVKLPARMMGAHLQLVNVSGQLMPVTFSDNSLAYTVSLGNLAPGIYFLQVVSNGSVQSFKISYNP